MEGSNDIIDKLKASVKAKLDELDSNKKRDSTLIDYIIVMVVNQKSKFEMKHNLALFLGKIVDEFVNWLFDYLATTSELKVKSTSSPTLSLTTTTSSSSGGGGSRTVKSSPKSASSPKEVEKSKNKSEPAADSKAATNSSATNGHSNSSSSSSQEVTIKGESKKQSTSKRKLKSAVSVSSSDDKDVEMATVPATTTTATTATNTANNTADATTNTSTTTSTKSGGKAKKRSAAADLSENSGSGKKTRTLSNSTDDGSAKKSKQTTSEAVSMEDDASKENAETKFIITLDGVQDTFKDNDGLFLDEDFDPELMNEDLSYQQQQQQQQQKNGSGSNHSSPTKVTRSVNGLLDGRSIAAMIKENSGGGNCKSTERCKYWPACLNGDTCEFFHPVTKCNNFPYCRFGDKCLYIHPVCKFDSYCTRKDCNFMHTAKVRGPPMHQMYPSVHAHHPMMMYGGGGMGGMGGMMPMAGNGGGTPNVTCKYFPNCMKPACEFFHPKICHYGAACNSFNCPFVHLPSQTLAGSLPAAAPASAAVAAAVGAAAAAGGPNASKFKWSSSKKAAALAAVADES